MKIDPDIFPNLSYLIGAYLVELNGIEADVKGFVVAQGVDSARMAQTEINQFLQSNYDEKEMSEYLHYFHCYYSLDEDGKPIVAQESPRTTLLYLLKVLSKYT